MIDPTDILALVADGPKAQADLTIWLSRQHLSDEANARHVKRMLNALRRAGHLKRVGEARKWALASYTSTIGRPRIHRPAPPVVVRPPVRPIVLRPPRVSPPRLEAGKTLRVVNGVEYEIVSLDDLQAATAQYWPSRGGSSLTAQPARPNLR